MVLNGSHIEPEFSSDNNVLEEEEERIKEQNFIWQIYRVIHFHFFLFIPQFQKFTSFFNEIWNLT